ncbi:MAG: T9SS type A sorting domain-containing protein [Patescibacteria group bacterium]|nr:T9SS type A sorting domain-containing protein [Patescibacteria group bacterium]
MEPYRYKKVRGILFFLLISIFSLYIIPTTTNGLRHNPSSSPYTRWKFGPSPDPSFFPIGVWLQSPSNASRYKAAGFNLYFGLWQGPTEDQLSTLRQKDMRVICSQNAVGLSHKNDSLIMGWMHGDEPDNAQWNEQTKTYDPPIRPQVIIDAYHSIAANDSTRPIFLNLGQGVANDEWVGRGPNASMDDYPEYCKGSDIVSFDVYPVVGISKTDGEKYLWYTGKGIDRLRQWTNNAKPVWNFIECTHISDSTKKATPQQVKAEVWMSLIHGSSGICYFVHQFQPTFIEAALLSDPVMLQAVTDINKQIHQLAPVLNSPTMPNGASVVSSDTQIPIDVIVKHYDGSTYLFAVPMRLGPTTGSFTLQGYSGTASLEVIDENRTVQVTGGQFNDSFDTYQVHLYKLSGILTGDIEEERGNLTVPSEYFLSQNYPNPFNPATTIEYKLLKESAIDLTIYNIIGQEIRKLVNMVQNAGVHTVVWDGRDNRGSAVTSGIYLYKIDVDNFSDTRKLVLLR